MELALPLSASAFAALTLAAVAAPGAELSERELSALGADGLGSCRPLDYRWFVEWHAGDSHETSYAETFCGSRPMGLVDVIAIVSRRHKHVARARGIRGRDSSILQAARAAGARISGL